MLLSETNSKFYIKSKFGYAKLNYTPKHCVATSNLKFNYHPWLLFCYDEQLYHKGFTSPRNYTIGV